MSKKIAMILSGCGNKDGAEITEAVASIICLSEQNADVEFFAPDIDFQPLNFLTNEPLNGSPRNLMLESARITRSKINPLDSLVAKDFDGLVIPGGFGVALHLSNWAELGPNCEVNATLEKTILAFHSESKPICAICIAPAIVAKVLGNQGVTVTLGTDEQTHKSASLTGANFEPCPVDDFITDRLHKVISTPAYMISDAKPHEVFKGIKRAMAEFMEMA
jgi:enhancing lycopene biosynthesis protein 2